MASFLGYPYINPVTLTSNQPAFTSDTINLKRQSVKTGSQRWELSINFRSDYDSNLLGRFMAHYAEHGQGVSFNIPVPQNPGVENELDLTDQPLVNGDTIEGDDTIAIDGGTFTLPDGLLIKFGNHSKVYMVVDRNTVDGTMTISPPLRETVANNTTIVANDVNIRVFHNAPNGVTTYGNDGTQGVTWTFIEAL